MPAVKAGTENPGFLFLKDLVVFHRCSHVIETAALIQIYILQRADQGSITFEMNERIVTHTAGSQGTDPVIDASRRELLELCGYVLPLPHGRFPVLQQEDGRNGPSQHRPESDPP